MKKILILTSVLGLAACGVSQEEVTKHDADLAQCERIITNVRRLVYKCPSSLEWIDNLKKQEPNGVLLSGHGFDWDEINADEEHTLVEVVLNDHGNGCKENFHYRTVIRPINKDTFYTFIGCK